MDASELISDEPSLTPHSDEPIQDNGLVIAGRPRDLERIYDYEAGGHHPLHLHDILHDRYLVIHKLGSGGYANVWLCRDISADSPKYVAVKIIMAECSTADCPEARVTKLIEARCDKVAASAYLSLLLDRFEIHGPNGTHYAFVYPVLGPRVSRLTHLAKLEDPGPQLREVCSDTVQSMVTLHAHGICHGDFRPANILTRIGGLDGLTEEDVLKILGTPQTTRVLTHVDESHDLVTAPQRLVYQVNWDDVLNDETPIKLSTGSACLTDFGESFEMDDPPAEFGIPQVYCSPEQVLERRLCKASDLWALGCTLFEIRTGRKLFDTFDDDPDEYLYKVATILGRYPEPWWSETWEARKDFFEDEVDADGKIVEIRKESSLRGNESTRPQDEVDNGARVVVFEQAIPRSLEEAISSGLVYESNKGPQALRRAISSEESRVFADLLAKILKYDPAERLQASDVLKHEWFKLNAVST